MLHINSLFFKQINIYTVDSETKMHARRIWLILSSICFVLMTMSLFLCTFFLYMPEKVHLQSATCNVLRCDTTAKTCSTTYCSGSTKSQSCYTSYNPCYAATITFELALSNSTRFQGSSSEDYSWETSASERCNEHQPGSEIGCFYDDRNPGSTLSLQSSSPMAAGIATIVIFTVFAFAFLIICIVFIARNLRHEGIL